MTNKLVKVEGQVSDIEKYVDGNSNGLGNYLDSLKLSSKNVPVAPDERMIVINNVPRY